MRRDKVVSDVKYKRSRFIHCFVQREIKLVTFIAKITEYMFSNFNYKNLLKLFLCKYDIE